MRKLLFTFLFFALFAAMHANNGVTYQLYKNNKEYKDEKLEQIIKATLLESFRAVSEDRTYFIEGYNVTIKLFSADFLQQKYNRVVSPLNIKDKNKFINIRFGVSDGKVLKPIL